MKGYLIAIIFIIGLGLGIVGMIYGPKFLAPYLPESVKFGMGGGQPVEGTVVGKLPKADKLLITVSTSDGASLVTFNKKVDEISLLVDIGDHITLKMGKYEPFVSNPAIVRVRKGGPEFGIGTSSMTSPSQLSTDAPKNEEPASQKPEKMLKKQDKKPEMKKDKSGSEAAPKQQSDDTDAPQGSPEQPQEQKI